MKRWRDMEPDEASAFAARLLDAVGPLDGEALRHAEAPGGPRAWRTSTPTAVAPWARVAVASLVMLATATAAALVIRRVATPAAVRPGAGSPPRDAVEGTMGRAAEPERTSPAPIPTVGEPTSPAPSLSTTSAPSPAMPAAPSSGAAAAAAATRARGSTSTAAGRSSAAGGAAEAASASEAPARLVEPSVGPSGEPARGASTAPTHAERPAAAKLPLDDEDDLAPRAPLGAARFDGLLERLTTSADTGDGGRGATLLLRALRALRTSRYAEAGGMARQYLEETSRGPFAEDAFAIAIVGAARAGDERAAELSAAYLRRFPDGSYRDLATAARDRSVPARVH